MTTENIAELVSDKKAVFGQLVISKSLIGQADDLAQEHESFYEHYIVGGRSALYELLGKIYGLAQELCAANDKEELVSNMRYALAKTYKIRTQENSSDISVLVRYITRTDRKTAHVYARAIETAFVNSVKVENFPSYIQEQGGIEQMRALGADSNSKKIQVGDVKEKLGIAKQLLLGVAEKPYAEFELSEYLNQFGRGCFFDYFVGINCGGKKYRIVGKINSDKEFEAKVLQSLVDMIDLDDPAIKKKVLSQIDLAKQMREKRWSENESKSFSERHLVRGEFEEVQDQLFNELFDEKPTKQ